MSPIAARSLSAKSRAWSATINGLELAGVYWPEPESSASEPVGEPRTPVLALHGWLDNAASMQPLLQLMKNLRRGEALALDLPGHGYSEHAPRHAHAPFLDYIDHTLGVLEHLAWPTVDLLGHSMGGAIACLFAAAFPERVRRMVLLDSAGPLSAPEANFSADLKKALLARRALKSKAMPSYPVLEAAINARTGTLGISRRAATPIVKRGTKLVKGSYQWRSDQRLTLPSLSRLSEPQVLQALTSLQAPTLMLLAEPRSAFLDNETVEARLKLWPKLTRLSVPHANHHFHLDITQQIASKINQFLS
jgi:pimeloyl-ACP methyl ester carboxylesterase